jgi:putative ATPase subunit gpP of terminase
VSKEMVKSGSESLVARIERAAHMVYLEGATEATISKALGIKGVTLRDWKRRPEWAETIQKLRERQEELVVGRLTGLCGQAVATIGDCLGSENDAVRLKAAQWILERGWSLGDDVSHSMGPASMGEVEKFLKVVMVDAHIKG